MPGVELKVSNMLTEELCEGVDIIFFNRLITRTSISQVEQWREKYGFKLVVDNDDYWHLGVDHYMYEDYIKYQIDKGIRAYIEISDAAFVTNERLWEKSREINPNTYLLPNAIPYWGQFAIEKTESELTRLFWAGSITHINDIELLRNPAKRFSSLPVKMVMGGYSDVPEYKRMASAFTYGGKIKNQIITGMAVEEYYQMYQECDISLVPLVENTFNSFKSNLKILEAANIASPVVVSAVDPYLSVPYVNYVQKASDWFSHVQRLVKNPSEAKEQGLRLQDWCKENFNFIKINEERRQILNHVAGKHTEIRKVPLCTGEPVVYQNTGS